MTNQSKTELCLFYKRDCAPIDIVLNETKITSKSVINVLGVLFDCKLQWNHHVSNTIRKSQKALNAIKIIRKYFNSNELLQLLTSNFYSILYYNSEVWHLPSLHVNLKKNILTASASALKLALNYPQYDISHVNLHKITNRATPDMFCKYKLALLLFKTFNDKIPFDEWISLNFEQQNSSRQTNFMINKNNNLVVGLNALSNRLISLNGEIPLVWLNENYTKYKLLCKKRFLNFQ